MKPTSDALLQAAEGQRSDQPDQASPQGQVRLAAAAVYAHPFAVHGLQLGFDREDENLDVGQCVPAVTTAGRGTCETEAVRHCCIGWCGTSAQYGEVRTAHCPMCRNRPEQPILFRVQTLNGALSFLKRTRNRILQHNRSLGRAGQPLTATSVSSVIAPLTSFLGVSGFR